MYKLESYSSNNNRSNARSRIYRVASFEETLQNPDTRDYSNVIEQSKYKSPNVEITPSADQENEEFLKKTDEEGTNYKQPRSSFDGSS